jgi:tetratricopeptide (TPR) repeat protein
MRSHGSAQGSRHRPARSQPRRAPRADACLAALLLLVLPLGLAAALDPPEAREWAGRDDLIAGREIETLDGALDRMRLGLTDDARARLREIAAAALDPAVRLEAWARLGESELAAGSAQEAAEAFARARASRAEPAEAARLALWEAAARSRAGDAAGALGALRFAAADDDPAARALAQRWAGWLEWGMGRRTEARAAWRAGLREWAPGSAPADSFALDLTESWMAESAWDSVLAAPAPAHPTARGLEIVGRAFYLTGRTDRADSVLALVTAGAATGSPQTAERAFLLRGWFALERQDPTRALESLARAGDEPLARYAIALALLQSGAARAADSLLATAPAPAPSDPLARPWACARAWAKFHLGRYQEAIACLAPRAGPPEGPLDQAAAMLRGDADYRLGRWADAYAEYARAASPEAPATGDLLWRQALAAFGSGQWGAAARLLDDLLLRFPGGPRAPVFLFWRGEALFRLGRLAEARTYYARAERLGADPARCAYALGWCDYREGEWDSALRFFDRARRLGGVGPLDSDLARRRGECLLHLGRGEEAAAALAEDASLVADTTRPAGAPATGVWAAYGEAQSRLRAGAYGDAARRFDEVRRDAAAPESLRLRAAIGCGEAARGSADRARAIACFREVCDDATAPAALRRGACVSLFGVQIEADDLDGARATLAGIDANFPGASATGDLEGRLAGAFLRDGRFRDALTLDRAALDRLPSGDPRRWDLRLRIADARDVLGEPREAATEYAALGATAGCPRRAEALRRAAVVWLRLGESRRALRALEARLALALDPTEAARSHALMATALDALGEKTAAANEWEKVARAATTVPDSLRAVADLHLGRSAFAAGQWDAAYDAFAAADSLGLADPGDRLRYWAGEAAVKLGACARAIRWFERFLERDTPEPVWEARARLRLGECGESAGRADEARRQYEAVVRLPDIGSALRAQARERLAALGEVR